VDTDAGTVELSKIFEWYGRDFAPDMTGVLQWIAPRLPEDRRAALAAVLASGKYVFNWGAVEGVCVCACVAPALMGCE
jgi:hypothetical protein